MIEPFCLKANEGETCHPDAEMPEIVAAMKQAQPSILLACSLGEGFFENTWIPVAHDGVFYTENALEKYLYNQVNTGFEVNLPTLNNVGVLIGFVAAYWFEFV